MSLKLRPYQEQAIVAINESPLQRPAILLPTGLGKTVIFATAAKRERAVSGRSLILVHRDELAQQALAKLRAIAPDMSTGLVKAERDEHGDADAVVASVQTLARESRRRRVDPRGFTRIVVDECHHAAADSYLDTLEYFGAFESGSGVRAVGFTATMSREDRRGLGDVWEDIVYARDIRFGIRHGYLCDVKARTVQIEGFDLGKVKTSGGEYREGSLSQALLAVDAGAAIAKALHDQAMGPDGLIRRTILFTPTVETAERFAIDLRAAGIACDVIVGDTPTDERQAAYERFRTGASRVLVNCMVLTEGFDAPWAEVAAIARATTSKALFIQMVGRVLRPWAGKENALVLDFAGIAGRLKLATLADLSTTPITIEGDETLTEAIERAELEEREGTGETGPSDAVMGGRLKGMAAVDLFEQSHSAWLQTRAGHWFIQVAGRPEGRTIFVWPEFGPDGQVGTWRVGSCGVYSVGRGEWHHRNLPIELAMSLAEDLADDLDPAGTTARRTASWRQGRRAPSDAQLARATRLGIVTEGLSKGELSNEISIHDASRLLDRGSAR